MKKAIEGIGLLALSCLLLTTCEKEDFSFAPDDPLYIADPAFLEALLDEGVDTNGDRAISYQEAEALKVLRVGTRDISSLAGIENFINLDTLDCSGNQLRRLDVSSLPGLVHLACYGNHLGSLDVSSNDLLEDLFCSQNELSELDLSKNMVLRRLSFSHNSISSIDLSGNPALEFLNCGLNYLHVLDLSQNPELDGLTCNHNKLE